MNEKSVLFLTRQGHALLEEQTLLTALPKLSSSAFEKRASVSELTLRHELEVMDVKAAFHSSLKNSERFITTEFSTWPRLHEFKARRPGGDEVLVKPDGFIRIEEKEKDGGISEHTFFLEVDRSSETQETLISRAGCYLNYYKSNLMGAYQPFFLSRRITWISATRLTESRKRSFCETSAAEFRSCI